MSRATLHLPAPQPRDLRQQLGRLIAALPDSYVESFWNAVNAAAWRNEEIRHLAVQAQVRTVKFKTAVN